MCHSWWKWSCFFDTNEKRKVVCLFLLFFFHSNQTMTTSSSNVGMANNWQALLAQPSAISSMTTHSKTRTTTAAETKPSFFTPKLILTLFGGACLGLLTIGGLMIWKPFGWFNGGWETRRDPSTVQCSPDECSIALMPFCPPGRKCKQLSAEQLHQTPKRVPCTDAEKATRCAIGVWQAGPAPGAKCVDVNTGQALSCENSPQTGVFDTSAWQCSTAHCVGSPPSQQPPPPKTVPCTTTSCENYATHWLPCMNQFDPVSQDYLNTCQQYPDPTMGTPQCLPGAACIGLPPTKRSCTACFQAGPWTPDSKATIGCLDNDPMCSTNPPVRVGVIQKRQVTCKNSSSVCVSTAQPSSSRYATNVSLTTLFSKTGMNYIGAPGKASFDWDGQPVLMTTTPTIPTSNDPVQPPLTFFAWGTGSGNIWQFYLQEQTSKLFLSGDLTASNTLILTSDKSKRTMWMTDTSTQSTLWTLDKNQTPWYTVFQSQSNSWSMSSNTNIRAEIWQYVPNLVFPLPVLKT